MRCNLLLLLATITAYSLSIALFFVVWSYRIELIFWAYSMMPAIALLSFSTCIVVGCALLGQLVGRALG